MPESLPAWADPDRKQIGRWLLLHALLVSLPCLVTGPPAVLALLYAWAHGGGARFPMALVLWSLAWLPASFMVALLANAWQCRGGPGLHRLRPAVWWGAGGLSLLQLASAAWVMGLAMVGDPVMFSLTVLIGAPWLTLTAHLAWLRHRYGRG